MRRAGRPRAGVLVVEDRFDAGEGFGLDADDVMPVEVDVVEPGLIESG